MSSASRSEDPSQASSNRNMRVRAGLVASDVPANKHLLAHGPTACPITSTGAIAFCAATEFCMRLIFQRVLQHHERVTPATLKHTCAVDPVVRKLCRDVIVVDPRHVRVGDKALLTKRPKKEAKGGESSSSRAGKSGGKPVASKKRESEASRA